MKDIKTYINEAIIREADEENSEKTTERGEIKFSIWDPDSKRINWLEGDETAYQKIEYVYRNKEKGITIDFLLGKKNSKWYLWSGKEGAVNYDDDPTYDLKASNFRDAIINALDKVQEILEDVKENPDNWVQFYVNR